MLGNEESLSRIVEKSVNEVYIFDGETLKFLYVNEATTRNLQYSMEELKLLTPLDIKPDYTLGEFHKLISPLSKDQHISDEDSSEEIVFETRHKRKDETSYLVEIHLQRSSYVNRPVYVAFALDITARKQVEDALHENEKRFNAAERVSQTGSWEIDLTTSKLYWSDEVSNIFELETRQSDATNEAFNTFLNFAHPDDKELVSNAYITSIKSRQPYDIEHRLLLKNGEVTKVVRARGESFYGDDGKAVRSVGTIQDITTKKESERVLQHFNAAIDASPDSIYVTDFDSLRFLYVNRNAAEQAGYSQKQLLNMGPADIVNYDIETAKRNYEDAIAVGEKGTLVEVKSSIKNSKRKWSEVRRKALLLDGRWVIITISRDIDERKENEEKLRRAHDELELRVAERTRQLQSEIDQRNIIEKNLKLSEERFYDIASSSADGFWETNSDLEFTDINQNFLEIVGANPIDLLSMTSAESGTDYGNLSEWKEFHDDLLHHRPFRDFQFRQREAEGEYNYVSISGTPVFGSDRQFLGYRGAGTDVTTQVNAEQHAAKAQEEMRTAKEEAEKASMAKTEFLSSMSHELRTPLNCILGFAQLLEINEAEFDEKQNSHVRHILSSGEHLLNLITDVLELNIIEEGRISLQFDHVLASEAVDDCLNQIQFRATEKNILLVDQGNYQAKKSEFWLWSDVTRLKQLLLNLLSNAVKYSDEGATVIISCQEIPNNMLRISVADTGPGIPPDRCKDLFTPFERLGRETGPIEGTGIGLSIVKRVVELLGGSIGYESEVGSGSTFWVDIPLSSEQGSINASIESVHKVVSTPTNNHIVTKALLYIEDDPDNQSLMRHILARFPGDKMPAIKMLTAHNAELGIDLARKHCPDIILMDINLPGMNGNEAVQKLKHAEETSSIPVIAISADATPRAIEIALECGFEAYITKPINVKEIQSSISEFLIR